MAVLVHGLKKRKLKKIHMAVVYRFLLVAPNCYKQRTTTTVETTSHMKSHT